METAPAYEPAPPAETKLSSPLQLVVNAQIDPVTWFRDLWTYIELTENDLG